MKKIYLHGKKADGKYVIVDVERFEELNQYRWFIDKDGYAWRGGTKKECHHYNKKLAIRMHRQIMGLLPGDKRLIDHINHNVLDNRKINLRICTAQQNAWNQRKKVDARLYKGVSYEDGKYRVNIVANGIRISGGALFNDAILAAKRYDQLAREHHKEFACLNFPEINSYEDVEIYMINNKRIKTSKYIGVSKIGTRWLAFIVYNNKNILLGKYDSEEEAYQARLKGELFYRRSS